MSPVGPLAVTNRPLGPNASPNTLRKPTAHAALAGPNGLSAGFSAQALTGAGGPAPGAEKFAPLVEAVKRERKELTRLVSAESFQAIPLTGRDNELLAVLLIGSSRADMLSVERFIRRLGLAVGSIGVLLGLLLAYWATARITRPVHELAAAAGEVAEGNWNVRVAVRSNDEIGELAGAFNQMTRQLTEQKERLVQSERVAAWRELARRLAHELKNPLFPLQITVENMKRVARPPRTGVDDLDWLDDARAQRPEWIAAFLEIKTVWHPVGM